MWSVIVALVIGADYAREHREEALSRVLARLLSWGVVGSLGARVAEVLYGGIDMPLPWTTPRGAFILSVLDLVALALGATAGRRFLSKGFPHPGERQGN